MNTIVKEKNVMPVSRQIYFLKIVSGIAWIIVGVSSCFHHLFFHFVQMAALTLSVIILLWIQFAKKEKMDEMASLDLMKAQSNTLQFMHIGLCIIACGIIIYGVVSRNLGLHITAEWNTVLYAGLFIYMGIEDFLTGVLFKRYEEE